MELVEIDWYICGTKFGKNASGWAYTNQFLEILQLLCCEAIPHIPPKIVVWDQALYDLGNPLF